MNDDSRNLADVIESTSRGVVKGNMFIKYFEYGSNICMVLIMYALFIATQIFVSLNDYGVNYMSVYFIILNIIHYLFFSFIFSNQHMLMIIE